MTQLKQITGFILLSLLAYLPMQGQSLKLPFLASQPAELSQKIGFTEIKVNYSRPRLTDANGNSRAGKIFGQVVPNGFEATSFATQKPMPWRAGANENTIISFSDDVMIEGQSLKAGSYGLFMAVYEDDRATVIFSNNTTSWGSFYYDETEDELRVDVITKEIPTVELLTYDFVDMGNDFGILALSWDNKQIPVKIEVDLHEQVLANVRGQLRSLPGFGWQGHQAAANYCLANNVNHEEALNWIDIAVQRNKSFQTLSTKAGLLDQVGKSDEAVEIYDEIASTATVPELNNLGYQLLGAQKYDLAIKYFKQNVEKAPENANCYDSLGEAYKIAGDKENAVKYLKKSLSMNPPPNVKANSEKLLKELGEL